MNEGKSTKDQLVTPAKGGRTAASMKRIWTIAGATVTQLVRMRIMIFLVVLSVIVVGAGFVFPVFSPEQQLKMLKYVSFGALQFFSLVLAIVATALLLPKDVEDRTLYTILSKPVPRVEYLIGKLLGVLLLIGGGLLIMDLILCGVLQVRQSMVLQDALLFLKQSRATEQELEREAEKILAQGVNWNMQIGVLAVFLKAAVITALALMISCFASSTLFTVICTFCLCIIGQGQELIREFFFHRTFDAAGEKLASGVLAVLVPDLRLFDVIDNVVAGENVAAGAAVFMLGAAALYVVGYLVVAHLLFVEKEL
jgi:ABC-type Na+ efflux pump permease subunit